MKPFYFLSLKAINHHHITEVDLVINLPNMHHGEKARNHSIPVMRV